MENKKIFIIVIIVFVVLFVTWSINIILSLLVFFALCIFGLVFLIRSRKSKSGLVLEQDEFIIIDEDDT